MKNSGFPIKFSTIFLGAGVMLALYASGLYRYVLFHSLVEMFSILVAFVIFILVWNTRRVQDNHYFLFIGIALFFSGALDLAHTLAYKGIGVFTGYGDDLATQLWIAFRSVFSLSFLIAPFFIERKLKPPRIFAVYFFITSFLLVAIFLRRFPVCYAEGTGLTPFKIISEYVISFVFLAALGLLLRKRSAFDRGVLRLVVLSLLSSIASELSFTHYVSVYGFSNMVGHYLELLSYYLIYRAIVVTGVVEPSNLFFRNLKLSEAALRESEAKYRSLFENMIDGFAYHKVIVDGKGMPVDYVFLEVNSAFEKLTGLKREDITGKRVREVLPGIENDPADWIGLYGRVALTGKEVRFEQNAGPLDKWYSVTAYSPMKEYFVAVFEDITERKHAEEALTRANADLAAANKELEAFAYSVSHDLRAPLRIIDGFSRAIEEEQAGRLDDTGRDYVRRVRGASRRMAQLIDALLNLSRLTRGELNRTTVDMSSLAKAAADDLRKTQPDRRVEFLIADAVKVQGDPVMLRAALENLLGNAWKFTEKRDPARIEFGVTREEGHDVYFVRDNGAGFDMAYANKLFTAFQRLHAASEFPGLGIGLATVQRIVHRHGGRIRAEGVVDKGATFYFTL